MGNEKFLKLMQDEEFVKKIVKMQTPEEVQSEFKKEGVELSVEEIETLGSIINKSIEKNGKPLTEDELLEISGGMDKPKDDTRRTLRLGGFLTGLSPTFMGGFVCGQSDSDSDANGQQAYGQGLVLGGVCGSR